MQYKNILLLGSKSRSRQQLLKDAFIDFNIIHQNADESLCNWNLPLEDLVKSIAVYKMEHIFLPVINNIENYCYILTADTLGIDFQGNICGKPINKEDAIKKIISYRQGAQTGTAFCLDKRIWKNGTWQVEKRIIKFVQAKYIFDIPDNWIERYFRLSELSGINYMNVSGAVAIEAFGTQFLKYIEGSYSTVVGLPMFELRQSLEELNFF